MARMPRAGIGSAPEPGMKAGRPPVLLVLAVLALHLLGGREATRIHDGWMSEGSPHMPPPYESRVRAGDDTAGAGYRALHSVSSVGPAAGKTQRCARCNADGIAGRIHAGAAAVGLCTGARG